ncbi:MAG: hypothetical protein ACT4PV_13330 [Planctomycetaceae bacterium]
MLSRVIVAVAGLGVVAFAVGLVASRGVWPTPATENAPSHAVVLLVLATAAASLLHAGACILAHKRPPRLLFVLLVAATARLVLLFGAPDPMLEGEPHRLRLEGRLVNLGLNPYQFRPSQLADPQPQESALPGPQLEMLLRARAALAGSPDAPKPEHAEQPGLRSTMPPLGQWIGALADLFKPRSTRGYAYLVLVADTLAMFFLVLALRAMQLPAGWLMLYAWCPVLLKEAYVTLARDAFMMPALAGLVWCIASGRRLVAAIPTAFCASLRPGFLLLLPVTVRRLGALGLLLACGLLALPLLPFLALPVPPEAYLEGPLHVWRHLEYNSIFESFARSLASLLPLEADSSLILAGVEIVQPGAPLGALLAKVAAALALLGTATYLTIRLVPGRTLPRTERDASFGELFALLAAFLLFQPVLLPQHALWLLPLLVVRPALSWLLLPAVLVTAHLTHLRGPDSADLPILGGRVSFRVLEFGLFGLLWLLDVLWRPVLFPMPKAPQVGAVRDRGEGELAMGIDSIAVEGAGESSGLEVVALDADGYGVPA